MNALESLCEKRKQHGGIIQNADGSASCADCGHIWKNGNMIIDEPEEVQYTASVQTMISQKQMSVIKRLAEKDGSTVSAWTRRILVREIRRVEQLEEARKNKLSSKNKETENK